MPQKKIWEEAHSEGICQDCLEREMGQWLEDIENPEAANLAKDAFSHGSHGKCSICGRISLYGPVEFEPGQFFDCLGQNLEYDMEEHSLLEDRELVMN